MKTLQQINKFKYKNHKYNIPVKICQPKMAMYAFSGWRFAIKKNRSSNKGTIFLLQKWSKY